MYSLEYVIINKRSYLGFEFPKYVPEECEIIDKTNGMKTPNNDWTDYRINQCLDNLFSINSKYKNHKGVAHIQFISDYNKNAFISYLYDSNLNKLFKFIESRYGNYYEWEDKELKKVIYNYKQLSPINQNELIKSRQQYCIERDMSFNEISGEKIIIPSKPWEVLLK